MKINELADKLWEGCDGCTEQDELMWKKGFVCGYNLAIPENKQIDMKTEQQKIVEILDEILSVNIQHDIEAGEINVKIINRQEAADTIIEQLEPEGEVNIEDLFNGVSTYTTDEGILLMSLQEFKWALEDYTPSPQQPSDSAGEEVRNIVSDAMDALALEFAMTGRRDIDVADHVDALTKKLTRPTVSEEEILNLAIEAERKENPYTDSKSVYDRGELRREYVHAYQIGFKAAIKELNR